MTDFSPLESALYESTPEKIAASLRYLRKADAVLAALMPLSAATQAPPAAAVPATMEDGWRHDICTTLNRVMPSWIAAGKTPIEAACHAIEALADVACEAHDKTAAAVPEDHK